jgi:hypothetical protein
LRRTTVLSLRALAAAAAATAALGAGALFTACSSVDLGDPPADVNACHPSESEFANGGVWENFLGKDYGGRHCYDASCHDPGSARSLSLTIPMVMKTATADVPIPLPPDWQADYRSVTENLQCTDVGSSPLLLMPTGAQVHGPGKLIEPTGPEVTLIEMWVAGKLGMGP